MLSEDVKNLLIECLNENIYLDSVNSTAPSGFKIYEQASYGGVPGTGTGGIVTGNPFNPLPTTKTIMNWNTGATYSVMDKNTTAGYSEEDIMNAYGNRMLGALGLGAAAGGIMSAPGGNGPPNVLGNLQNRIGGLSGKIIATAFGQNMRKLLGLDQFAANVAQIVPNQEALRREGLGYTKGWARLAGSSSKED